MTEKAAMLPRTSTRLFALLAALMVTTSAARAADDGKYPNWQGQWARFITRGLPGQARSMASVPFRGAAG